MNFNLRLNFGNEIYSSNSNADHLKYICKIHFFHFEMILYEYKDK